MDKEKLFFMLCRKNRLDIGNTEQPYQKTGMQ